MTRPITNIAFLTSVLLLSSIFNPRAVNGQGLSLSIYPPVIEVEATPPSSPLVPIVIQNNKEEDVTLKIELIPFKTDNISGDVQLMPALLNQGFYPYYKERIQFLEQDKKTDTITLEALESKEINLNINLSKGDPPGDYYYSIIFISQGGQAQDTTVSQIPAGIASNLLLSVGPRGESSGGISHFSTSSFKTKGPVSFSLKLHNASKHVIAPTGNIVITNMFGQKVGSLQLLSQYILAGGDRYLLDEVSASAEAQLINQLTSTPTVIWNEKFLLGWYKAVASIRLDEDGKTLSATSYFIAFPLYFFIPIVLLLFITISIYLKVKKKI